MQASDAIEAAILALGDAARAEGAKRYLKSEMEHLGATNADIRRVVRERLKADRPDHDAVIAIATELWDTAIYDLRLAAVIALTRDAKRLTEADVPLLERFLREAKTWALVDPLSTDVMGPLVVRLGLGDTLDRWARDGDFWVRRASMLTLLKPLRAGAGDWERFARYADAMLDEKELFIRKAIGWILRDVGRKRPALADAFIGPRTHRASGVTMREVIKVLPEARAAALMGAYRAKRPAT